MLTKQDFDQCGMCMALDARNHTRLGNAHRWLIGDPIANWKTGEVVSVRAFIDHAGDHVVAFHPFTKPDPMTPLDKLDVWMGQLGQPRKS